MLFRRIVLSALLTGLITGALLGVIQLYTSLPIILAAESLENHQAQTPAPDARSQLDPVWSPQGGLERNLFSIIATIIIACAYALLLQSVMQLSGRARTGNGLWWGLAGYLVFFVVPALGQPPQVPGIHAASVEWQKAWWLSTSASTAAALVMLVFARKWIRVAAIPLLLLPFAFRFSAPSVLRYSSNNSDVIARLDALQQDFILVTAITLALFWMVLGLLSGWSCENYLSRHPRISTAVAGKAGDN